MAQRQSVTYISDLSEKEITDNDQPTVLFGLDGRNYSIDLSDKEQEKFRDLMAPYIAAGKPSGRTAPAKKSAASNDAAVVREWANSQGLDVPERGRLPKEIREQWEAAGSPK